jgi:hypothetical protein
MDAKMKSYWLFVMGYWGRDEEAASSRSVGILPTSSIPGRAMRPRSADSCRDVQTANESEGTRMGEKRGSWIEE